ncbi:hypothetical protein CLOP_g24189, partial [Closterium sp. NIES-67]
LPPERDRDHKIGLEPGAQPIVRTQWRLTRPDLDELRRQLDYLLKKGFVRPSTSPLAAPILFTPKKDGGLRMCIDYCALNQVTIKSRYPIPYADELIDQLRGVKFFSKIDMRGDSFRTQYGSFEYTVMPFGLTNASSMFQLTMNEVFRPLLDKCVIVYLDDILIYSTIREQHLMDLEAVFSVLQQHRLRHPHRPFELVTDTTDLAVGVVLLQDFGEGLQPIAYESRKLNPAERNYHVHDKELLAIVHAFKVWRYYLTGADSSRLRPARLLQPLEPPSRPWQQVTMDFVTGLPNDPSGNDAILVVVDRLTKMAHFAACKTTITAEQTMKLFLTNIVRLHGIPSAIITDRDLRFTSNF